MTHLSEGMEYSIDGDIIDRRDRIIRKLKSTIDNMNKKANSEEKIRNRNAAVNDAWERYQTVLRLAKNG